MSVDSFSVSCFAPIRTINPKYRKLDAHDKKMCQAFYDDFWLKVPCGKCYLCRKRKANSWRVRLIEEFKTLPSFMYEGEMVYNALFVMFSYKNDKLANGKRDHFAEHIRKWRDLWRKKYGKSPRYFIATDKGSQFARLHMHVIIFNPYDYKKNRPIEWNELYLHNFFWRNGKAYIDFNKPYVESMSAVTYVTAYLTGGNLEKDAIKHGKPVCAEAKQYVPFVFVSRGLGANFVTDVEIIKRNQTQDTTYNVGGFEYALPIFYRNKIFDYETRWWMNRVHRAETEHYIVTNYDKWRWRLNGTYYDSVERVESVYANAYAQFDKTYKFSL